jgi:4,5-dihydroxyphthalate decarboxylase
MGNLRVNFACALYDRMVPLYTGEVAAEGIDLNFIRIDDPRNTFDRMVAGLEFDACEMSMSEFISRSATDGCPFVGIPVFPLRAFRHGFICINRKSGIKAPKDMEGKRIGVPLYEMSAAIYARGHLEEQYGVDLSKFHWVQGAINAPGTHGKPSFLPLLRPIRIEYNSTPKSLSQLLEEGAIDAIVGGILPDSLRANRDVQRLFPNYHEVEREFYKSTKIFPIMHMVAIKRDLYEKNPFVATSLYDAFCRAKQRALEKMTFVAAPRYMLPWLSVAVDEIHDLFGGDPWPYGTEANRPTIEAILRYMVNQAFIARAPAIEDLFLSPHGSQVQAFAR